MAKVMSGRSVNLATLFLGSLRPLKRLTSTSCTYFRQLLITALLESAEVEVIVCCWTGINLGQLALGSDALPIALRSPAIK